MRPTIFEDPLYAWWGPIPLTYTMVASFGLSVLLVALAALLEPLLAGAAFVLTAFFAVVALVFDEAVFELEAL